MGKSVTLPSGTSVEESTKDPSTRTWARIGNAAAGLLSSQWMLLAGITFVAALLRFYKLGEWSFWIDEIYTVRAAPDILRNFLSGTSLPGLSFILADLSVTSFGANEWSARLPSAVIGILSIPVLYFPIKKLFDPAIGLLSVLLLAISPWHLYWSQNARFYTSMLLLYSLALFAFFVGVEQGRFRYILISLLWLVLALGERTIALIFLPVAAGYLFLLGILPFERPPWLRIRIFLIPLLLFGVGFVLFNVYQFAVTGSSYLTRLDPFIGNPIDDPFRLSFSIISNIRVPLIALGLVGGVYLLRCRNRAGLLVVVNAVVPPLLLVAASPFVLTLDRYVFITLPSWCIVGAVAIKAIHDHLGENRNLFVAGLLLLVLLDVAQVDVLYYTVNNGNRRDWKTAFGLIEGRRQEGDVVVSTRFELGSYYLQEEVEQFTDLTPNSVVESGRRHWFAVDNEMVWANTPLNHWLASEAELIEVQRLRLPEDVSWRIYLYDPERNASTSP